MEKDNKRNFRSYEILVYFYDGKIEKRRVFSENDLNTIQALSGFEKYYKIEPNL